MISPRISSTRGDLGAETLRRELLAFDPPDAGPGTLGAKARYQKKSYTLSLDSGIRVSIATGLNGHGEPSTASVRRGPATPGHGSWCSSGFAHEIGS
jgi:hypothetical protein